MNDPKSLHVVMTFDATLSNEQVSKQELTLVAEFLSELLKEMVWQTSEQEN